MARFNAPVSAGVLGSFMGAALWRGTLEMAGTAVAGRGSARPVAECTAVR
jgi:hypothetical protein